MASIRAAIASGRYRYTLHAAQQRIARRIDRSEIEEAVASGDIIEDYPEHHYGPACLVFGRTSHGRLLHLVLSARSPVDIITIY